MKSPAELTAAIERHLARTWHLDVTGAQASWPHTLALGRLTSAEIARSFAAVQGEIGELRNWAATHRLKVRDESRNVAGTTQLVPSHIVVPDIDAAAAIAGRQWVRRVTDGRRR
ncbi:MAG: hypothetical protein JST64_07150, partial [Actinobacteria bacterium]|nr:hypothetical protein [Actinomycetota bacterium]